MILPGYRQHAPVKRLFYLANANDPEGVVYNLNGTLYSTFDDFKRQKVHYPAGKSCCRGLAPHVPDQAGLRQPGPDRDDFFCRKW